MNESILSTVWHGEATFHYLMTVWWMTAADERLMTFFRVTMKGGVPTLHITKDQEQHSLVQCKPPRVHNTFRLSSTSNLTGSPSPNIWPGLLTLPPTVCWGLLPYQTPVALDVPMLKVMTMATVTLLYNDLKRRMLQLHGSSTMTHSETLLQVAADNMQLHNAPANTLQLHPSILQDWTPFTDTARHSEATS